MTDPARTHGQHARPVGAEAGNAGDIPTPLVGLAGRWALAAWRALLGDPGRGSVCCP